MMIFRLRYVISHVPCVVSCLPARAVMTTNTPEKQDGLKTLEAACDAIRESINAQGGKFEIKMAVSGWASGGIC